MDSDSGDYPQIAGHELEREALVEVEKGGENRTDSQQKACIARYTLFAAMNLLPNADIAPMPLT